MSPLWRFWWAAGSGKEKCLSRICLTSCLEHSHYININVSSCYSHPSSRYYSWPSPHRQGACSLSLSPGHTVLAPGQPGGCPGQKWITTSLWPSSQPCWVALTSLSRAGCPEQWPMLTKLNLIYSPVRQSAHEQRPQNASSALVLREVGYVNVCIFSSVKWTKITQTFKSILN